jgi:hypothetical protein
MADSQILSFVVPQHLPGWIERLPDPLKSPGGPSTAIVLMMVALAAGAIGAAIPPRPRKLHFDHERQENQHVVKISDCRTAIEESIKGHDIMWVLIRYFGPTGLLNAWLDPDFDPETDNTAKEALQPLVDKIVFRIADFALSQQWQRHATHTDFNVRGLLRKGHRERGKVIEFIKPPPPGVDPEPIPT